MSVRMFVVALCCLFLGGVILFALVFSTGLSNNSNSFIMFPGLQSLASRNEKFSSPHRKLLIDREPREEPNRLPGERCSRSDIVISQSPSVPLSTGIPTYTVDITNMCFTGCDISRIHLACGWFSSDQLIERKIFKRLRYNVCLVNNGKALAYGATLSFQYANSYRYPLSVSSVTCS